MIGAIFILYLACLFYSRNAGGLVRGCLFEALLSRASRRVFKPQSAFDIEVSGV